MKLRIIRAPRCPPWPLWAVAIVAAWLALVAAGVWLSRRSNVPVELCLFRKLTGVPCPTCGATRGVLSILHGRPLRAWALNPLLFTVAAAAAAMLALRVASARSLRVECRWTRRGTVLAWGIAVALVLANWAYVIATT